MGQVYAIFRNTLLETVRQPVFGLVLTVSSGLIALTPATAAHVYSFRVTTDLERVAERMVADLGLATVLFAGLVLGVFTSTGAISREINNRTASTILSKRVSRMAFVVGKYLGVAGSILLATLTGSMIILLTIRAGAPVSAWEPMDWGIISAMITAVFLALGFATWRNYFFGRAWIGAFNFAFMILVACLFVTFSVIDRNYNFIFSSGYPQQNGDVFGGGGVQLLTYDWEVARAAFLTSQAVLLVASIAVAASTRLNTMGTTCVTGMFIVFGLTSDFTHNLLLKQRWGALFDAGANALYMAIPNLEKFWMSDALTREQAIPLEYLTVTTGYAWLYVVGMLLVAGFLLEHRDVG